MDDEAAWLQITDHNRALRQSQRAGQGICGAKSRGTLSDRVSVDTETETNLRQERVSIKKRLKVKKMVWVCAPEFITLKEYEKGI